jgi:HSP20 family protein
MNSQLAMKFAVPVLAALAFAPSDAWNCGPSLYSRPLITFAPAAPLLLRQQQQLANKRRDFSRMSPRYEITENDEEVKVAIDLPGVKPEDVNVSIEEDGKILSISGFRESSGDRYSFTSKFSQNFALDPTVDVDKFTANLQNGVLIVSAPKDLKRVEESIRKIPVNVIDSVQEGEVKVDDVSATAEKIEVKEVSPKAEKIEVEDASPKAETVEEKKDQDAEEPEGSKGEEDDNKAV